jgi:hypothetical protein
VVKISQRSLNPPCGCRMLAATSEEGDDSARVAASVNGDFA